MKFFQKAVPSEIAVDNDGVSAEMNEIGLEDHSTIVITDDNDDLIARDDGENDSEQQGTVEANMSEVASGVQGNESTMGGVEGKGRLTSTSSGPLCQEQRLNQEQTQLLQSSKDKHRSNLDKARSLSGAGIVSNLDDGTDLQQPSLKF